MRGEGQREREGGSPGTALAERGARERCRKGTRFPTHLRWWARLCEPGAGACTRARERECYGSWTVFSIS